jgi:hypothetical protein
MSRNEFQPAEVLHARLASAGFTRRTDGDDVAWRKAVNADFIQDIGLGCKSYGKEYSISISLGVYVAEVERLVATLLEEEISPADTVGGNFSQIRTKDRDSGWYIPANEAGRSQFEGIADDLAVYGVPLLDKYCDMNFLADFCLKEMKSPGSSELGINHSFPLPAILFLTKRFDECEESLRLAEARLLERFSPEEAHSKFTRHYHYFKRLRELLAASK